MNPGFDFRRGNASCLVFGGMLVARFREFGSVYTERGGLCKQVYSDCIRMVVRGLNSNLNIEHHNGRQYQEET